MDGPTKAFLANAAAEAADLAASSDLLHIQPGPGSLPDRYLITYCCNGVFKDGATVNTRLGTFALGIWFPPDYLRYADPQKVLTWLGPMNVFHPNIAFGLPVVCLRIEPAQRLGDIVHAAYDLVRYAKVTMDERDALNPEACAWARDHTAEFPVDRRPLRRRQVVIRSRGMMKKEGGAQ